ncbi:MAG: hypothetical protein M1818_005892 [Claussenomyces sp. TS43310]|nr:MAG: hypothetical protein M1818_005892 [Claussenomyces sp. TS43310]
MQDPSQGVHRELLPHVHLLSTYRFPILQSVHHSKIAEWLLHAPKIASDQAPFFWTYLDRPADGTILLTWQPLEALGTSFATDGYLWPPAETAFQLEVDGGYTLEMYQFKHGFGPGEPFATHARRRYRLLPSKFANPTAPTPDGSLWIVHYSSAEPNDQIPSNLIPTGDIRSQQMNQTRMYLQTQGQIVQKEFMLHDRTNWPQIQLPRNQARVPAYSGPMVQTRTPQALAYPPHAGNAGPPAKRARTQANANPPLGSVSSVENGVDDEEDTSRGDLFDHMTPREVSVSRYKQNHEWMEEILSSPYSVGQIMPVDLGLGLRGELGKLTDGIFHPPAGIHFTKEGQPIKDDNQYAYVGKLDEGKAEEFRKRTNERIAEAKADMEKMKARHERRMAKFNKGLLIVAAEKKLRTAVQNPDDVGTEYWRLEGKVDDEETVTDAQTVPKGSEKVDDIVAQVEASLGRHTAVVQELRRLQDGGLEDSPVVPSAPTSRAVSANGSQRSGVLVTEEDLDMGGSAAGLLDQFHTGFSSTSTPANNFPTPQPPLQNDSAAGTPNNGLTPQPPPDVSTPQAASSAHAPGNNRDEPMTGAEVNEAAKNDQTGEAGEWVVVPEGGLSPPSTAPAQDPPSTAPRAPPAPVPTTEARATEDFNMTSDANLELDLPDTFAADPTDFSGLEDLDTAGEALAGYGGDSGTGGPDDVLGDNMDLGMDLGMDDSAFGDAFHGVEAHEEEGQGEGEGM